MFENDTAFFSHTSSSRFQKIPTAKNTSSITISEDTMITNKKYGKITKKLFNCREKKYSSIILNFLYIFLSYLTHCVLNYI